MYELLFQAHSYLRYAVLLLLLAVVVKSAMGWFGKQPFTPLDKQLSLFNLIAVHIQATLGFGLYFTSPWVQFVPGMMKDSTLRYWAVEHISMMLIAAILITIAHASAKRMPDDQAKFKRLFIFNTIAIALIVGAIIMSKRGLI